MHNNSPFVAKALCLIGRREKSLHLFNYEKLLSLLFACQQQNYNIKTYLYNPKKNKEMQLKR